jgi:hypothetical protein
MGLALGRVTRTCRGNCGKDLGACCNALATASYGCAQMQGGDRIVHAWRERAGASRHAHPRRAICVDRRSAVFLDWMLVEWAMAVQMFSCVPNIFF